MYYAICLALDNRNQFRPYSLKIKRNKSDTWKTIGSYETYELLEEQAMVYNISSKEARLQANRAYLKEVNELAKKNQYKGFIKLKPLPESF